MADVPAAAADSPAVTTERVTPTRPDGARILPAARKPVLVAVQRPDVDDAEFGQSPAELPRLA
jgi:hypothetical protein